LQLKWVHQAQFAGYYVAIENGYYAEQNIHVTLVEGGPDIDIVGRVAGGQADFGVDAPEQILAARSRDEAVKAVAVIYRLNPMVFISMADSGIETPQDFAGHTIAILGSGAEPQYVALMKKLDLDMEQVKLVPYSYDNAAFYSGQVDLTVGYTNGSLIRIRQAGCDVNTIWPGDYGVHLYADTLFTTDQLVAGNPDLVTHFLRASLRGWKEAVENPGMAVQATMKYAREADVSLQTEMMKASVPLVHTGEDQIGWMKNDVWQGMEDMLFEQGVLDRAVDVKQVYSMEFLHRIYGDLP
jgi:NitT/TauT family transport system substrate-binding protein